MTIEKEEIINRAIIRAEGYLEFLTSFIKKKTEFFKRMSFNEFKLSKTMDWFFSNSHIIFEEVRLFGYGEKVDFVTFPIALEIYYLNNDREVEESALKLREFLLRYIQELKEKKDNPSYKIDLYSNEILFNSEIISEINDMFEITGLKGFYNNQKEKKILMDSFLSLLRFEKMNDYKFSMIMMGSILEYLLKRYCNDKKIKPSPFKGSKGKSFANYIESAINNDLFGEKKRWELLQSHLRDFRNYIHIEKEIRSTEIDKSWYNTMKPVFESILDNFKSPSSLKCSLKSLRE